MKCSSCGHENIAVIYTCEVCQHPLAVCAGDNERDLVSLIRDEPLAALHPVPVQAVAPDTAVGEVIQVLADRNIGCVLIVEGDKLVGIFSERDALRRIGTRYEQVVHEPIRDFMTPAPETLTMEDSIAFALNRMDNQGFRHVPVKQEERVAGIISIRDVIAYLMQQFPELTSQDHN